jgi:hypothetical protein
MTIRRPERMPQNLWRTGCLGDTSQTCHPGYSSGTNSRRAQETASALRIFEHAPRLLLWL